MQFPSEQPWGDAPSQIIRRDPRTTSLTHHDRADSSRLDHHTCSLTADHRSPAGASGTRPGWQPHQQTQNEPARRHFLANTPCPLRGEGRAHAGRTPNPAPYGHGAGAPAARGSPRPPGPGQPQQPSRSARKPQTSYVATSRQEQVAWRTRWACLHIGKRTVSRLR